MLATKFVKPIFWVLLDIFLKTASGPCFRLQHWYICLATDKGKPVEIQGRKATGLRVTTYDSGAARETDKHACPDVTRNVAALQHLPLNYVDSVTKRVPGNFVLGT